MLTKVEKAEIVRRYAAGKEKDTGNTVIQIALFTKRVNLITEHLKTHKEDHSSRRGLLKLVGKRKAFIRYLGKKNPEILGNLRRELQIR